MEGSFKNKLTDEEIKAIIQQTFNCKATGFMELSDGWANTAYSVTKADGETVILKVAPAQTTRVMRSEKNMMKTEVAVLNLLGQLRALPLPAVYAYDDSKSVVKAEYFIMERIQGTPYNKVKADLTQEETETIEEELGAYNRIINECHGSQFGYYSQKERRSGSWADAFNTIISDVLADGRDAGVQLPRAYSEIEANILSSLEVLQEVTIPSLIHWDLWNGNIFVKDGHITGIIDFERALWADPLMEHYFSHFERSAGFARGYGLQVLTDSQRKRRALYDLYLDLLLWIECTYRNYEDRGHLKWAYENLEQGLERFDANR